MASIKRISVLIIIANVFSTIAFANNSNDQLGVQYPYLVRLQSSEGGWLTTGTIIDKNRVLTAFSNHFIHKTEETNAIYTSTNLYEVNLKVQHYNIINYQTVNGSFIVLNVVKAFEIDPNLAVVIPKSHEKIRVGLQGKLILWLQVTEVIFQIEALDLTIRPNEECEKPLNGSVDNNYYFCVASNGSVKLGNHDVGAPFMFGRKQLGILHSLVSPNLYLVFRTSAISHQLHLHRTRNKKNKPSTSPAMSTQSIYLYLNLVFVCKIVIRFLVH